MPGPVLFGAGMTQVLYKFGACTDWFGTGPGYFKSNVPL